MPLDALEVLDVLDDELVGRDDDVERRVLRVHVLLVPELAQNPPVLGVAPVRYNLKQNKDDALHSDPSRNSHVLLLCTRVSHPGVL